MVAIEQVTFKDKGSGPVVLFVPGSFSTPAAWRDVQNSLPQQYRMVTTSLLGYGNTPETRNLDDFGIEHEVNILAAVGRRIDEPVHLVGHSFGATVGLAAALAGVLDVLSITTFEANPVAVIREQGYMDLFASVQKVSTEFELAYQSGERLAAKRIIDYWGGDGSFFKMPQLAQDYCKTTTFANVLDWRSVYTFDARLKDYERLTMPVLIVRGEHANSAMSTITEALSDALPNVRTAEVKGANHFLINSHAPECALLLSDHLLNSR